MLTESPSLANASGTLLDSACKHIQQCRVSFDHMLDFVDTADQLEKNELRYCVHKDEVVVGVTRPWKKSKTRALPPSAYPKVISNLGNIASGKGEQYDSQMKMIKYLFHYSTSLLTRQKIIDAMSNQAGFQRNKWTEGKDLTTQHYLTDERGYALRLAEHLQIMHDHVPVGISNTLGYAHHNSGDTMTSVMIGGQRTVMNGKWEVSTGDPIQWYWTFEEDCFRDDGSRKHFKELDEDGEEVKDFTGDDPKTDHNPKVAPKPSSDPSKRREFNDRQFGTQAHSLMPSDKAKNVARIKTYVKDENCPRIYDQMRVFAKAINCARPYELLDIMICRQSM